MEAKAPASAGTVVVDRYKGDMAQARAMQRAKKKPAARAPPTRSEVDIGLHGIDEAERLRDNGKLTEALKIYEMSLELLIRHLGTCGPNEHGPLRARVRAALNSAESIKELLNSGHQPESSPETTSPTSRFSEIASALSSALRSSPQKKPSPRVGSNRTLRQGGSARQGATMPAASDNPMHQAVLSDLFVPSADLRKTSWNDIAGLKDVKQGLQEAAILPLMRPDLFTGLRRPQNILLWGPPGTGKTMLVRAVANESGCNLFACSASALTSKWMGESEKIVRALFQVAHKMAPSIVFLDEMDAMLSSRKSEGEHEASRRLKTEFMVQMEGITNGGNTAGGQLLLIGCTNCPWDIDSAVLRRFPRRLLVPLPDPPARRGLIDQLLKTAGRHNLSKQQRVEIAKRTKGFSCSDITSIASEASFGPIRSLGGMDAVRRARDKDVRPVAFADFEAAIAQATKSISPSQLKKYDDWKKKQSA